ncbi:MAG: cysteine--tRNA ligase [Phycisphaerae bacterium]
MSLKLYNSLSRQREEFVPLAPPRVGFYKCGMTVYGPAHLGHAKSSIHFDVMVRWLRHCGYDVTYVQNITDVGHLTNDADDGEDPVVREARRRGLHPMAVAETFTRDWLADMESLNMLRPDIMPRASGHVSEQIELSELLIAKGHAYVVNGSVYFDVSTFPAYGRLSGRRIDEGEAGTRVGVRSEKRQPADFALWKRADPEHLMRWNSPWGIGFPGWHLECSAMGMKYLGETFDIHGGGLDNLFPHHECEIAQSEAATGKPFVRYWLHNNMCTVNAQKMSKSLGNGIAIADILRNGHSLLAKTFEAAVVRHFILTSHYRATLDFSNDALAAAESGSHKLRDALRELDAAAGAVALASPESASAASTPAAGAATPLGTPRALTAARTARTPAIRAALEGAVTKFAEAMDEDFNSASALATLFDVARQTSTWVREAASKPDLAAAFHVFSGLTSDALGLCWSSGPGGDAQRGKLDDVIQLLVDLRNEARKSKNFALGDQIRQRLSAIGVELRDGAEGTKW